MKGMYSLSAEKGEGEGVGEGRNEGERGRDGERRECSAFGYEVFQ